MIRNNLDLFSQTIMESACLVATYPLNTIKTRIQAKNAFEDVAFF
jgi:hypothetical protein